MKKLIDISCFGDAKVWLLYGRTPKQAKAWIKRRFQLDIKQLVEDSYSGITISISNLEWVVFIPSNESTQQLDLLKAVVHEAGHVAQQLAKSNAIQDEEAMCLIIDYLVGKMASIMGIV